ncbi:DUF7507 domain-containing protein [Herbidospora yilanensis]|uniref:DUF7927 domain-containing protein n=1 Tax=Herbidospora yilanensis TaxID=354426 RepID=UPI000AE1A055|nr:fibronectin type III domain-containing protein [Herbidospora yilanensis]
MFRRALAVGLVAAVVHVPASVSHAAGSTLFVQPFKNNTIASAYPVSIPALPAGSAGTNAVCLSAAGNTTGTGLKSCTTSTDANGSGVLRLTSAVTSQQGGVFGATSVPTSQGLDVTFNMYQYGGGGADGLAFVVAAVDPANPVPPATIGRPGGSLGYSPFSAGDGLANAYLGFGFDAYGNFSNSSYQGSGCSNPPYISTTTTVPGQVVVRGPGAGTVGYCAINSTATSTNSAALRLRSTTRSVSVVPVAVAINPTSSTLTTAAGLSVAAGTYVVQFTPVSGASRTLTGTLPTVSSSLYPSSTWTTAAGIPRQLAFGWVASTGGVTDFHEIDNVVVNSLNPVPDLSVTQTSYNGSAPKPGDPVTYTVRPVVSATGANETLPISVTETLPAGVVPVGAFGAGWVCGAPSGQKITCTNSGTPFAGGTTLPTITVVGIVTGSSVTPSTVQTGSTVTVSSNDGNPGIATTTTAGTIPAAPSGLTLSTTSGTIAGGGSVTVSGSNLTGATAVEIGTTAEQQAGTPVVLLPCSSVITTNCFTANANGTLTISSMPSRPSAAAVTVTVVTQGVAGSAAYTYTSAPGTPAAPTATAGATSATVTWTAPSPNGSPITGYVVTPYLNGVAQTPISYSSTATTQTLTGLTAGASYTFTVAAVNTIGTGTASAQSNAVVPYTVPGRPTITSATAGDLSATLTWSPPAANGGSAVTGYIVTPYLNGVEQTPISYPSTATTQTVTGLTAGASYTFTVAAVNAAGTGSPSTVSATVTPNANPRLTFGPPPGGQVNVAYNVPLTMTGGTAPTTWSISAGSPPPGVTLNPSTGLLSGTPTSAGTYDFTVRIVDAGGQSDTRAATVTIVPPPVLTVPTPPAAQVAVAYNLPLSVSGGTGPYTYSLASGTLPPGVTLNTSTGLISGTPTTQGAYAFTVKVTDTNGQSDTRSGTVTVGAGPLVITKTADQSAAVPGSTVSYTITVANTGPSAFTGVTLSDPLADVLDDATYDGDLAASLGNVSFAGQNVTWTGNLAAGATATITYSVTVRTGGNGILTDTVSSPASGTNCAASSGDSRCRSTVTLQALVIGKTADAAGPTPGATVNYTITVTNTGKTAYSPATFSDALAGVLDDATYNNDAAATSGTVNYGAPTLSWSGNLPAGASATITYSVTVRDPDPGDRSLTNTVTSASPGNNCPCTSTVTTLVPRLTVTTATDVSSTTPTGVVRYTVTATNTGQTTYPAANFTLAPAGDATYGNDATATSGNLTLNPNGTITWTGPLAPGQSVTATASVTVGNPATGAVTGNVTSTTAGLNCVSCTTSVPILQPRLTLTKTASSPTVTPGDTVTYTITAANTGQTPYQGATFTESLAGVLNDAVYNGDAAATSGTLSYNAPVLSWTGDLAVGATATVTYTVTVKNPDPGDRLMINTVVSSTLGSTCPSGSSNPNCTSVVNVLVPGLSITRQADRTGAVQGDVIRYTITAENTGQTPYTGASLTDQLAQLLDDAVYNGDAAASSGTVTYTAPNLTWTGNLAVGATTTITYSVTVRDPDPGDGLITGTVVSTDPGSTCPTGCSSTVRLSRLALSQAFTETSTTPGSVIHLSATFANTGQMPYTGLTVAASSADVIDDAVPNGDQVASSGNLVLGPTGINWTGDIPVGGTVTVTGTLTVRNPGTGNKVIRGTLVSDAPGGSCPAGGTDPACTARIDVLVPALTITTTPGTTTQEPGGVVHYTTTITNTGQTPYTGISVTDDLSSLLDDAVYGNDASATTGTAVFATPQLTWTGDLAVGASAIVTYSVTVRDPDPGDKQLINAVTSAAPGSTCVPACTSRVVVLTPALTVATSADRQTAVPGDTVTFTTTITNTGQTPYLGTTALTDLAGLLDDAAYGGDAVATSGSVAYTAPVLTWTGGLAVGAGTTITFTAVVDNPDLGDRRLTAVTTSAAKGADCPAGSAGTPCAVTVPVTDVTDLTFTKTADPSSVVRGGVVTYTITVANSAATTYVGATFTDPLTGVLDDATYNGDLTATSGTAAFTSPNVTWTGNVPAGGAVTVTYSVTVDPVRGSGDDLLTGALTSASPGGNCPAGGADPRCSAGVTVSELDIAVSSSAGSVKPGQALQLTAVFTNTGQTPYRGIRVSIPAGDLVDAATPTGDTTLTSGTLSVEGLDLVWTGDVPVGGSVTVASPFTANAPPTGNRRIATRVVSAAPGSNCPAGGSGPSCALDVPVLVPELTIAKTADRVTAEPGDVVAYTITIANTGETPYTGISVTDPLAGTLDDAVYGADAAATTGSAAFADSALTWTGDLAVGVSATVTYTMTVRSPDPGDKIMANTVTSDAEGVSCGACASSVQILTPALTIVKSASPGSTAPGGTVTYTITATNSGQTSHPAATFTDALAGVLDDAVYNDDGGATRGTVGYSPGELAWTGALAPGQSATITYSVTVRNPDPGDRMLSSRITSPTTGGNCGTDPRCGTDVPVAVFTVVTATDRTVAMPGDVVRYTVTATNTGRTDLTPGDFTLSLAGALANAEYNNDALVGGGALTFNLDGSVTWNGPLAPGESVTATASITVIDPGGDGGTLTSELASTTPGLDCQACTTTVTVLIPELTLTTVADRQTATPGDVVTYTITAANTGEAPYQDATWSTSLVGVLGDADYGGDATATSGVVNYAEPTLSWTGDLAVGAVVTVTFSVRVKDPDPGDDRLTQQVVSPTSGATCPGGPSCSTTVRVLTPQLTITKQADTASIVGGGIVHYTVTVANTGETSYTGATYTDPVGVAIYGGDAWASSGFVSPVDGELIWTGDLAEGVTATVTYSARIDPAAGNGTLATTITSPTRGSNCAVGSSDPRCSTTIGVLAQSIALADLTRNFTLTGPPDSTRRGDGVVTMNVITNSPTGYTVTVRSSATALTSPVTGASIPISALKVRSPGTSGFRPLSATTPIVVHQQSRPSAQIGDSLSNDYEVDIPFVPSGSYSVTLDYIASTS